MKHAIKTGSGTKYNDKVSYQCKGGHFFEGKDKFTARCLEDRKWSHVPDGCPRKYHMK